MISRRGFLLGTTALAIAPAIPSIAQVRPAAAFAAGEISPAPMRTRQARDTLTIKKVFKALRILDAQPVPDDLILINEAQYLDLMREPEPLTLRDLGEIDDELVWLFYNAPGEDLD